jgi:hypothetical protein
MPSDATNATDALTASGLTTILSSPTANALTAVPADIEAPSTSTGKLVTDSVLRTALGTQLNVPLKVAGPGNMLNAGSEDGALAAASIYAGLSGSSVTGTAQALLVRHNSSAATSSGAARILDYGVSVDPILDVRAMTTATGAFAAVVQGENQSASNGAGVRGAVGTVAAATGNGPAVSGFAGVNGTRDTAGLFTVAGANTTWGVQTNGAMQATAFTPTSDARLKSDIVDIDIIKAIELQSRVRFVEYVKYSVWVDGEGKEQRFPVGKQAGVIAQELKELTDELQAFQYLVLGSEDKYYSVDYNGLYAILNVATNAKLANI